MTTLWKASKIDPQITSGPKSTTGEAVGAMFRRNAPAAGFAPAFELDKEAYEPLLDFAGRFIGLEKPGDMIEQPDGSYKAFRVPPELEEKLTATMTSPLGTPEFRGLTTETINEFTEWAQSNGIEVPGDISASALAKRKERLEVARESNVRAQDEILGRASAFSRVFGGFIGGVAAEFTDPGNLLTLPVGASARAGLLATVAIESTLNAGIEAWQTPARNEYLRRIGQEETSMIENAAFGAAFGGVFAGIIKGAPKAARAAKAGVNAGHKALSQFVSQRLDRAKLAEAARNDPYPEVRALAEAVLQDLAEESAAVTRATPEAVREHTSRAQAATESLQTGDPLTIPDRPSAAVPRPSILNGQLEEVDPRTLLVEPERWQFKSDLVAPGGLTPKLLTVKEWDPASAGVVLVYEYPNGSRAIVDGHQRTGLANRIMAQDPSQDIRLAAKVFREIDGFTQEDVRVLAALKNIREAADGMTAKMATDAAKILRIRPEAISNLPTGPGIVRARELSALSDDAFGMVINRVIPADQAALIGRLATDKRLHTSLAKLLARTEPDTLAQAESILNQALQAPVERETMADLFGESEVVESLYVERAKVLERTMKLMRDDRQLAVTLTEKSGRVEGIGKNKLDRESNQALRETMEKALTAVSALAHRVGPISEALNDAAKQYRKDGRLGDAAERVRAIVRDEIDRNGLSGGRAGDDGRPAESARPREPTPDPLDGFGDLTGPAVKEQIEATRIDPEDPASVEALQAMIRRGAGPEELEKHPLFVDALAQMKDRAAQETNAAEGYGSETWHGSRQYVFGSETVTGTEAALGRWIDQAEAFAGPDGVELGRTVTIVMGPPAAGKSTISEELAITSRAAILDSDEIKKTLPEYENGIGAAKVHEESSDLAAVVEQALRNRGANLILPKVGSDPASIQKVADRFRADGYRVKIVNMAVSPEEAYRRMVSRFVQTGRLIPPDYLRQVGDRPSAAFRALKKEGKADGYAEIDNNGGEFDPKPVREIDGENPLSGSRYDLPGGRGEGLQPDPGNGTLGNREVSQGPLTEATSAGDQTLIPGIAPISSFDRIQARADAPLVAAGRRSDSEIGGLFDPNDPSRFDLFDLVPTGRSFDDSGNEVATAMTRAELAAELDAEDEALAVLEICVTGATR